MTPAEREREYWRKHREDMVRQELKRQGKLPNFVIPEPAPLEPKSHKKSHLKAAWLFAKGIVSRQ